MQMDVGHTLDGAQAFGDTGGDFVVLLPVDSRELDVDGSGEAEVEDLRHDVGGLEEEGQVGELRGQLTAQGGDVRRRRFTAVVLQRDEDLAGPHAGRGAVPESHASAEVCTPAV